MKKLATWGFTLAIFLSLVSSTGYTATPTQWLGQFHDITPVKTNITEEYCKAHVLEDYITTAKQVEKEVKSNNGVIAKNIKDVTREEGGVYFISGTASFVGTYNGKAFNDTVHYYAHSLTKTGAQKGVWYTNECKGWYEVGPIKSRSDFSKPPVPLHKDHTAAGANKH